MLKVSFGYASSRGGLSMLNIWFGLDGLELEDRITYVSDYFDAVYEPEWLQSEMAKQIIKAIDDSVYVSGEYIESPVFGGISPRDLSTGCKALLILLNESDVIVSGERMGDNCYPWLLKLAENRDITITLCHTVKLEEPFKVKSMNTGEIISTNMALMEALF